MGASVSGVSLGELESLGLAVSLGWPGEGSAPGGWAALIAPVVRRRLNGWSLAILAQTRLASGVQ